MKSKVAVIKTKPESVLDDVQRLMHMADLPALPKERPTVLKDNISWHLPFPGANTTPWQLEGVIRGLTNAGYTQVSALHNNTVVTDPFKGERLNRLEPVYRRYGVPELYNFKPEDVDWIRYKPKAKMLILDQIFRDRIMIPEYLIGKNVVHLPTVKCHI